MDKMIRCSNCVHSYMVDDVTLSCEKSKKCLISQKGNIKSRVIDGETWYFIFSFSYPYFKPKYEKIMGKFDIEEFVI